MEEEKLQGHTIQQKTFENRNDWISRLPDSLLLHILSHLKIKEAIQTCLLSRRWRYVWTSISCLDFQCVASERKIEKTTFIDNCVFYHQGSKVRKLRIIIEYDKKHVRLVDSWIRFAVRSEVEFLQLDLLDEVIPEDLTSAYTLYKLPHYLFECGSLTNLMLRGCDLNLPINWHLSSLKTLNLQQVDLYPDAIQHITSCCPLLEDLNLKDCNKLSDLNIFITNEQLKNLYIDENGASDYAASTIKIHAPNLISLEFRSFLVRTNYCVTNLQSLMIASFTLGFAEDYQDLLYDEYTEYDFTELLVDLSHVKEIELTNWCIQVFSAKEIRSLDPLLLNASCVKLWVGFTKWELPGIAYLMQSARNLEAFQISICDTLVYQLRDEFLEEYDFDEKEYWKQRELDLSSILLNTKTIKIIGFQRCHGLWGDQDLEQCWENEMEFVRFLLRNSKVLEEMVIEMSKHTKTDVEVVSMITDVLIGFPRASPNARLVIT